MRQNAVCATRSCPFAGGERFHAIAARSVLTFDRESRPRYLDDDDMPDHEWRIAAYDSLAMVLESMGEA